MKVMTTVNNNKKFQKDKQRRPIFHLMFKYQKLPPPINRTEKQNYKSNSLSFWTQILVNFTLTTSNDIFLLVYHLMTFPDCGQCTHYCMCLGHQSLLPCSISVSTGRWYIPSTSQGCNHCICTTQLCWYITTCLHNQYKGQRWSHF